MERDMENSCWKIIITMYQAPTMCQTTAKVQLWSDISSSQYTRRRQWQPASVLLPRKSHGWRSLVGCSPESLRVGLDWATSLSSFTFMHWKWQPTPGFLPGESQRRGSWWAAIYGVAQSQTLLKRLSSSSSTISQWDMCCHLHFIDEENKAQRGLVTYPWSAAKKP